MQDLNAVVLRAPWPHVEVLNGALTADAIKQLVHKQVAVVRVKEFFGSSACVRFVTALRESRLSGEHLSRPGIKCFGRSFHEASISHQALMEYFCEAQSWLHTLREACEPQLQPIDKLRLQLDECWDRGANLGRIAERTMHACLIRVFEEGALAEPHQDHLEWQAAPREIYGDAWYHMQLAASIHLQVPEAGGELALWPVGLSRMEYEGRRTADGYAIDVAGLGEPVRLRPERGELILFNARNVHRVEAPIKGQLVCASCSIGYRSYGQSLSIWS